MYVLAGSGLLSAPNEYVGYNSAATALLQQSSGLNTVTSLSIEASVPTQWRHAPGQQPSARPGHLRGRRQPGGLEHRWQHRRGLFRGHDSKCRGRRGEHGTKLAAHRPSGIQRVDCFFPASSLGLTYVKGSTFLVPAGQQFVGLLSVSDPVNCQGAIAANSFGTINLNNGLVLSGSGNVSLGSGNLTVNDAVSTISGGSFSSRESLRRQRGHGLVEPDGRRQQRQRLLPRQQRRRPGERGAVRRGQFQLLSLPRLQCRRQRDLRP